MEEIEAKILDIDIKEIEEKLQAIGAEKISDSEIIAHFFDYPDNFIRNAQSTVRLRSVGDKAFLTFKRFVSNDGVKRRNEHEVQVSSLNETRTILESLGLSVWETMQKRRISYKTEDARFEIDRHHDQYKAIPPFLEIEAKDEPTIYRYAEKLGYTRDDCKPWTIKDIVKHS